MQSSIVRTLMLRELAAVRRAVEAYPDDTSPWLLPPGLPNSGGTLALHLAGNIQHYVGAVLGGSAYRRDRPAEFSRRDVPRSGLVAELDAARATVDRTLPTLTDAMLAEPYREPIAGQVLATDVFLAHLAVHLAYHLGQIDYHRRTVTGNRDSVGAIAVAELPGLSG